MQDIRTPWCIVYYRKGCTGCENAEARLDAHNIPYDMVSIDTTNGLADAVMAGFDLSMPLPFIEIKDNNRAVETALDGIPYETN